MKISRLVEKSLEKRESIEMAMIVQRDVDVKLNSGPLFETSRAKNAMPKRRPVIGNDFHNLWS